MKKIIVSLSVLFALCECAWGDFDKGLEAFRADDFKTAFKEFQDSANNGDARAMAFLGDMYMAALGVEFNEKTGLEWFKKSHELGDVMGSALLANAYANGYGVSKSPVAGYRIIQKIEASDEPIVQMITADFYANGWGTERNYEKAREVAGHIVNEDQKERVLATIAQIEKENTPMPAADLMTEAQQNRLRFDRNYKDKEILVEGYVQDIEERDGVYTLKVMGLEGRVANPFKFIECKFGKTQEDALLELNRNEVVRVRGTYKGKQQFELGELTLLSCEVVK